MKKQLLCLAIIASSIHTTQAMKVTVKDELIILEHLNFAIAFLETDAKKLEKQVRTLPGYAQFEMMEGIEPKQEDCKPWFAEDEIMLRCRLKKMMLEMAIARMKGILEEEAQGNKKNDDQSYLCIIF